MKYEREVVAPAPTLTGNGGAWVLDRRQGGAPVRRTDEPAHTMAAQGLAKGRDVWTNGRPASTEALRADDWPENRPGTTIAGDPRVFPPGGHHVPGDQSHGAVRVTVQQAAILQTFPPDHPWAGSRTKQFEHVGNAVPPMLAKAILEALLEVRP